MDTRRYKFPFGGQEYLSILCDIFEADKPKSYLPSNIEAQTNINFMPIMYPPTTLHRFDNVTNKHLTCGPFFLILKENCVL